MYVPYEWGIKWKNGKGNRNWLSIGVLVVLATAPQGSIRLELEPAGKMDM